jgi:serine O-acetyltransferase
MLKALTSGGSPHAGSVLGADLRRAYETFEGGHGQRLVQCLRSPGVHAVVVLRFGQWVRGRARIARLLLDPLYLLANLYVKVFWGMELSRHTRIGPGLYIGHFGGITVSPLAVIGRDCTISQSTTIGVAGQGARAGAPTIGDDVYIAPGARVFGKIRVGNNVKIGANAVVYRDVPENAVVVADAGFRILNFRGNRARAGGENAALADCDAVETTQNG